MHVKIVMDEDILDIGELNIFTHCITDNHMDDSNCPLCVLWVYLKFFRICRGRQINIKLTNKDFFNHLQISISNSIDAHNY
jgi:hypothetical protein